GTDVPTWGHRMPRLTERPGTTCVWRVRVSGCGAGPIRATRGPRRDRHGPGRWQRDRRLPAKASAPPRARRRAPGPPARAHGLRRRQPPSHRAPRDRRGRLALPVPRAARPDRRNRRWTPPGPSRGARQGLPCRRRTPALPRRLPAAAAALRRAPARRVPPPAAAPPGLSARTLAARARTRAPPREAPAPAWLGPPR